MLRLSVEGVNGLTGRMSIVSAVEDGLQTNEMSRFTCCAIMRGTFHNHKFRDSERDFKIAG